MSEFIVITIKLKIPQRRTDQVGRCTVKFGECFQKKLRQRRLFFFFIDLLPQNPTFSMAVFYGVSLSTQFGADQGAQTGEWLRIREDKGCLQTQLLFHHPTLNRDTSCAVFLANQDSEIKQINLILESQISQTATYITVLF